MVVDLSEVIVALLYEQTKSRGYRSQMYEIQTMSFLYIEVCSYMLSNIYAYDVPCLVHIQMRLYHFVNMLCGFELKM